MKNESGNPYRPALCFTEWVNMASIFQPFCQGWWWMLPIGQGFHRAATSIAASGTRVMASDSWPRPKAEVQQRTGYCTPCTPATSSQPAKKCQAEEKVRIGLYNRHFCWAWLMLFSEIWCFHICKGCWKTKRNLQQPKLSQVSGFTKA